MNRYCWRQIVGSLSSILVLIHAQTVLGQADPQRTALDLICVAEQPAIVEGDSTRLHAWATTEDDQMLSVPVSFAWHVTEGTVQGTGGDVQWELSDLSIDPGKSHKKVAATVKAMVTGQGEADCTLEVLISKKEETNIEDPTAGTRGGMIAGRRYLLPNQVGVPGYGLYSYLLLSGKPKNEEETARYLKTLEACLQVLNKLRGLEKHVRQSQLNATHIPVTEVPKGNEDDPDFAKKILSVYDYARAKVLLSQFENTYDRGPYLISVKKPLTKRSESVPIHILQNFTGVVPELAAKEVRDFEFLAAQQRTWTEQAMRRFPSKLRNLIAIAGKVTPGVATSLRTTIQFVKFGE